MKDRTNLDRLNESVDYLKDKLGTGFKLALILGSGYSDFVEKVDLQKNVEFNDIPGFPSSTIEGQGRSLYASSVNGKRILIFGGRFHFYQGYSLFEVTMPERVAKRLGAGIIIITNSAGGINKDFKAGDVMLIEDHINLIGNPLRGLEKELGERFIDMSEAYSSRLLKLANEVAARLYISDRVKRGVYLATQGPSYETPAEIRFFRKIGADAVGMSTAPEVIVSVQEGMEVLGVSLITNMAAGLAQKELSHREVIETSERSKDVMFPFLLEIINEITGAF